MHKSQYFVDEKTYEKLSLLTTSMLDAEGREVNNPVSSVKVKGDETPLTLKEQIKRILRTEVSAQAAAQGLESFEEANDFDVQDSFDAPIAHTKYETVIEEQLYDPELEKTENPPKSDSETEDSQESSVSEPNRTEGANVEGTETQKQ